MATPLLSGGWVVRAELVEARALLASSLRGGMLVLRAGAGSRPGGRVLVLCFAKEKYPKERRPPVCDPFALLRGKPAAGRLRGAPQNSLRCVAAPFGQLRRARQRSTGAATPVPPRNRPAAGAASRGGTAEHPNSPSGHRCARPRLRGRKRLALRKPGRAQRSEAMARVDVRSPGSLQDAPRSAGQGTRACAAGHTHFVL